MNGKFKKTYNYGDYNVENNLFKGDNIEVVNFLLPQYKGSIDCIYIDPPYNNAEKYLHYNDNDGHEIWIEKLKSILPKLFELLSNKGSLWISIDDREMAYLKVAADKLIGREKFLTTIVWQHRTSRENRTAFSNNHEYILVYAKNLDEFKGSRNLLSVDKEFLKRYRNPDNDHRGLWQSITANVQAGHAVKSQFYTIVAPNGKKHNPPAGRCWAYNKERMLKEIDLNNIWFGKDGNGVPRIKKFLKHSKIGLTPQTLWLAEEVGDTNTAKKHLKSIFKDEEVFDTPKPESLLERIIKISTDENELVLDAYLGSGTTAVVAQRLNRKYIGIEVGDHINDIAVPRLNLTIDEMKLNNINQKYGYNLWEKVDY